MAPKKKQTSEEPEALAEKASELEKPAQDSKTEELLVKAMAEQGKKETKHAKSKSGTQDRGALVLGGGLLFMGVLLLLGQLINIPFEDYLWPFIFIVPGVLVFFTALSTSSSSGEGLSILGGILTMLGLVFLGQSITGLWATWAYVWALVAPTSIGIAQLIYGMNRDRDAIVQSGRRLANLGLLMFAVGFVFFELIIGISGFGLASFGLPVFPMMLIFIGIAILVRSVYKDR